MPSEAEASVSGMLAECKRKLLILSKNVNSLADVSELLNSHTAEVSMTSLTVNLYDKL